MTTRSEITAFIQAHLSPPAGLTFYSSLESVRRDAMTLGYTSVLERAWAEIKINGALCLNGRPLLYVKEHGRSFSSFERVRLQRLVWNQGVANVLVLADPESVYIYSGLTEPPGDKGDEGVATRGLVEMMTLVDYTQRIKQFSHALATGHYYEVHQECFQPEQSVDSWLLNNLRALRDAFIKGEDALTTKDAHSFIGRMLFLCYLLDRRIISVGAPDRHSTGTMTLVRKLELLDDQSRMEFLYTLFADLKCRFNGNMFDQDIEAERHRMSGSHIETLIQFLGGHSVANGQRTLGFWPYDFKMIPIETISAIYQDFLSTEDEESQRRSGAFYTPRFLAEMVIDVALGENHDSLNWSFLDPACGSGIFLVILFNRLTNHWLRTQPTRVHYSTKADKLQEILRNQISGVDVEETACRIACFSLYLAYLDFFDPPDILQYIEKTKKPLPKLLDYGANASDRPSADLPVIHKANFLAGEALAGKTFDCIIGNPPWEGRQGKQLAQKFVEAAPSFLQQDGIGCLLLPSKMLQNQTNAFQGKWLVRVTLEKVLQLADYSFLLFQKALCPAVITRFKNVPPDVYRHEVEFVAPKFNREGLRQGVIIVDPSARVRIPMVDILSATKSNTAPVIWKRHLWGTRRDQKLLDLLQSLPALSEQIDVLSELRRHRSERTKRWISGQGIKPWPLAKTKSDRDLKPIAWPPDTPFIEATEWNSDLFVLKGDAITLEERLKKKSYRTDVLYSQPPSELFRAPIVLVSQGFGKVAYCDFDVLFQDSLQSIAGPEEDRELLMFLAAFLRSGLARYFLFHTSANWGSERDKVHLSELLRVPFPLPTDDSVAQDAEGIVEQVARQIQELRNEPNDGSADYLPLADATPARARETSFRRRKNVEALQEKLNVLIYRYFGLTEQEISLIEDTTRVFEPSSTPTTWRSPQTVTLDPLESTNVKPYSTDGLRVYAETLSSTLNRWAISEGSQHLVKADAASDNQTGLAVVAVRLEEDRSAAGAAALSKQLTEILADAYMHSSKKDGMLFYRRDLFLFQSDQILIVRPNILLNWTRTAALNDAAKIYGEISLGRKRA